MTGRPHTIAAYLIAILALVLSMGGAAVAGGMITGKQIKNNTVKSADIKNGSLHLKDINKKSWPLATPPRGTTVIGGGIIASNVPSDSRYGRGYAALPFKTAVPLTTLGSRNIYFGNTGIAYPGESNPGKCSGSAEFPTAAPGFMCIYVSGTTTNVSDGLSFVFAGSNAGADGSDSTGFYVGASAPTTGEQLLRFVWAYTAP